MEGPIALLVLGGLATALLPWILIFVVAAIRKRLDDSEREHRRRFEEVREELADLRARLNLPDRPDAATPPHTSKPQTDTPAPRPAPLHADGPFIPPVAPPLAPVTPPGRPEEQPHVIVALRAVGDLSHGSVDAADRHAAFSPATAPDSPVASLEQRIGSRWIVWVGAAALALAGIFLVRHIAQMGWLGPAVRVSAAALFGLLLVGVAEFLRPTRAQIAQGLAAAAIAVLYAALVSAVNLHSLISPWLGFALMALVTAGAVALSLRHGPFVALLGMVGGFVMPGLLRTPDLSVVQLFGYLLLLSIGLAVVSRHRNWWWLTGLTMIGAFAWAALWLLSAAGAADLRWMGLVADPDERVWVAAFLLTTIAAFVATGLSAREVTWEEVRVDDALPWGAVIAGLALEAWLVGVGDFGILDWAYMGLLGAGCVVLARLRDRLWGFAPLSASLGVFLLWVWVGIGGGETVRFNYTAAAFGLLYAGGSFAALWRSARPGWWAYLCAGSALIYFLMGWWADAAPITMIEWWHWAVALGVVVSIATVLVWRVRLLMVDGNRAAGALALGAAAFFVLAVPLELERQWITVAWAAMVPVAVVLAVRLAMAEMRWVAVALVAGVLVRLIANPWLPFYPIGEAILFNWLLYGYGIPIVAIALAGYLARRGRDTILADWFEVASWTLGAVLVTLLIRHGFHPDLLERTVTLKEWATYSFAWFVLGGVIVLIGRRLARDKWIAMAAALSVLGAAAAIGGAGIIANPLWRHEPVGSLLIFNWLLYCFALPAMLAALLAPRFRGREGGQLRIALNIAALLLAFAAVTLEVRQAFAGDFLDGRSPGNGEWYAYSAAWIVFAALLLTAGIVTRGRLLRIASLIVLIAAVAKVFLFDTRHLEGLWRAASFFGLGITLMLVAYVYQRFVFREVTTSSPPQDGPTLPSSSESVS